MNYLKEVRNQHKMEKMMEVKELKDNLKFEFDE